MLTPWDTAVEVVVLFLAVWALVHGWKNHRPSFWAMLGAMTFGLLVEAYFVNFASGYRYGEFLFMLPAGATTVPVWVAAGWGAIIYCSLRAADRAGLSPASQPAAAALLAVSVDMTLDPIAQNRGWWDWARPAHFFGIPYDNYIGWCMIVGFYTGLCLVGWSLFEQKKGRDLWVPPLALVGSVLAIVGCTYLLENAIYPLIGEPAAFAATAGSLLLVALGRLRWSDPILIVPMAAHALMGAYLVGGGLAVEQPELLGVFLLAAGASAVCFGQRR